MVPGTGLHAQGIVGTFWSIRDEEFKDIRLQLSGNSISDGEGRNLFELLEIGADSRYYKIGEGTYISANGIVSNFKLTTGTHKLMELIEGKKGIAYRTLEDIEDSYCIRFENSSIVFWYYSENLQGQERMVQDVPIIIVEHWGLTTENLNLRVYPSIDSTSVICTTDGKSYAYMPKGTNVFVKARTKNKYEVKGMKNYWYLVEAKYCSKYALDLVQHKYVWAFGQYIEYEDIMPQEGKPYPPSGFPFE
jgi:hypothetical protein